jgi:Tol biopolymer transport system component
MPDLRRVVLPAALLFGLAMAVASVSTVSRAREAGVAALQNGKIAFTSNKDRNVEIYVMNADGGNQIRLTNNDAFDGDPAWSPDGSRIVFTSTRDGNEEIYVMNANGTNQTRLTNNSALDRTPAWSPDGSEIVFASNRDGATFDIFVMTANGTSQRNISRTGGTADLQDPDWSPDGSKIACSQALVQNGGALGLYGVMVMNADGSNQTRLSADGNIDITPRWSPNGTKIIFASNRSGNLGSFEVFTMSPNGSNQLRIINNANENSRPAWSPDGTMITFQSDRRFNFDVFVMNADGSNQNAIGASSFDEAQPVWQPVSAVPFNPIDDPSVFVRRQYLDFLDREPDSGGQAYWTSQITQCGNDQACINRKRVDVAAAFFIEQEFQQTGFFIDRVYRGALCRRPAFAEFTTDRSGIVVGSNLEANKVAFVQEFVTRTEFVQRYGTFVTASQFVDAVLDTVRSCSGVDLTSQRAVLIGEYNGSADQTSARARVLRLVIDNQAFIDAELNSGFVLSQYFGFLRRDPDQAGFDFWLNILNTAVPGNFRSMVCAFITSAEYQRRFGPAVTHTNAECGP